MSRRGRQASLPRAPHHRPAVLATGGLVVEHRDHEGRVVSYDFAALPLAEPLQRSMAALFGARCTPGQWSSHETSEFNWQHLSTFARWLSMLPEPPSDVDEITAAVWDAWRLSRSNTTSGYHQVTRLAGLLLDDPRVVGSAAEALARRSLKPEVAEQSYATTDFDQIKVAARRTFRSGLLRIQHNARHLERWAAGEFTEGSQDCLIGEALDCLARTGDVPTIRRDDGGRSVVPRYAQALGGEARTCTWERLFLTRMEATALGMLLVAEFGLNLSVIDVLAVPRATPDSGADGRPTYRMELLKRKRGGGRYYETRNITDHDAASSGRLITQALEATRFARAAVDALEPSTDRLIVWRTGAADRGTGVGWFRFGIPRKTAQDWGRQAGAGGSPFRRGRRTVHVVERREPGQNSQDTHDSVYVVPDPQARKAAVPVVAAAAESARLQAERAVLVAELRNEADPDDVPTATADCHDFEHSPFPTTDGGCGASFLACLGCTNARVHPGHHARLAHLHRALTNLRSAMDPALWQSDWGDTHARLEHLSKLLGAPAWNKALADVTNSDRELIDHLLTGELDA